MRQGNSFRNFILVLKPGLVECIMRSYEVKLTYVVMTTRRILMFPKGNNSDHLSLYLDVADSSGMPPNWSISADFSLCLVNQKDPSQNNFRSKHAIRAILSLAV